MITNVKVDFSTPATVNAELEAGKIEERWWLLRAQRFLQTETAHRGSTIAGRQQSSRHLSSRATLSISSLPFRALQRQAFVRTSDKWFAKSALTIQIDGVDVHDNFQNRLKDFLTSFARVLTTSTSDGSTATRELRVRATALWPSDSRPVAEQMTIEAASLAAPGRGLNNGQLPKHYLNGRKASFA